MLADDVGILFQPTHTLGKILLLLVVILYYIKFCLDIIQIESTTKSKTNLFSELNNLYTKLALLKKRAFLKDFLIDRVSDSNHKTYSMKISLLPNQVLLIPETYLFKIPWEIQAQFKILSNAELRYT
jgi:hypothetical protein